MEFNLEIPQDFSGIVSVYVNNKPVFEKTYGYRDWFNKIDNNISTSFDLASGGKTFVAIAILQLIEQEKIHFDSSVKSILKDDYFNIDESVTIKMLLTHTSGVQDYFDESNDNAYDEIWRKFPNYNIRKNDDIYLLLDKIMMEEDAGEVFRYNNLGYVLLATIIEKITEISFYDYIQKEIIDKVGLTNTGYFELDKLPENTSIGYIFNEDTEEYTANIYSIDARGTGAGGIFSTAADIQKLWQALNNQTLLSMDMANMMQINQLDKALNQAYGFGLWIFNSENALFPYMIGVDPGVFFISSHIKEKDVSIVLISNNDYPLGPIHKQILQKFEILKD
ncbi:serine hydrolase domain-containing protein [Enterococcus sp. LJL120]